MKQTPNLHRSYSLKVLSPLLLLTAAAIWLVIKNPDSAISQAKGTAAAHTLASSRTSSLETATRLRGQRLAERGACSISMVNESGDGSEVITKIPARNWIASGWADDPDPALAEFSSWVVDYLAATPDAQEAMIQQGLQLAGERRRELLKLMKEDPRRALAAAIPDELRASLPVTLSADLEQSVNTFGNLLTEYRCGEEQTSRIVAEINGEIYPANVYGERMNLNYYLGSPIHGILLDGQISVLDGPIRVIGQTGESTRFLVGDKEYTSNDPGRLAEMEQVLASVEGGPQTLEEALASKGLDRTFGDAIYAMGDSGLSASTGYPKRRTVAHTHGGKKILILRLQSAAGGFPASETVSNFNNWAWASDGWNARLNLTTYNKTWLDTYDVTPILTLPQADSYYVHPHPTNSGETVYESGRWASDGEAAAATLGYNISSYDCVVVCTKDYPGGGFAWALGKRIWVNGKFSNFAALMNHEFGHTLGLPHASAWTATDGNPISPSRSHVEYGDENDPMGNGGKTFRNTYQAYFKNLQRWMPDSSVQTITGNGTYTVYQDDGATALNRTLALKVGRDREILYWLSIRGDLVQTNSIHDQSNFINGVSIVAVTPTGNPHTLDLNNPGDGNRANTPLALNQTWYDSAADITFKTVEVGGSNPNRYAKIQVTFGPAWKASYRPLVSGASYRFKNAHNGKYLTVPGNSSANAVPLAVADLNTANDSQVWVAWRQSDGTYQFNHRGTDKWIDVQSNSSNTGATIWQYNFSTTGDNAQRWNVFQTQSNSVLLLHNGTPEGRLIEMDLNNQAIHQMTVTGNAWQQWVPEIVGIVPGTYRLLPMLAEGQALSVSQSGTGDGPDAVREIWSNQMNQRWTVSDLDNGRIRLAPSHVANKALDVSSSGTSNGTRIQQWNWNNTSAQRWSFSRISGHWLRFTPDCAPSACMDANGTVSQNGVKLWNFSGSANQQWRFADAN